MADVRTVGCALCMLGAMSACAVDVSGIPVGDSPDAEDLGLVGDLGPARDLGGADLGPDLGPPDFGPPPDLFDCTPVAETCDGMDEDCDGRTDEGLSGQPCDGDDDGCMDGRSSCTGAALLCEGDDAVASGDGCDGPDADDEPEGTWTCETDALTCADDCVAASEACNQRDDDCDGAVDEDGACSDSDDDCRSVLRGDAVYLFCTGGDSWGSARDGCARGEYDLAQIDDEAERAFLAAESGSGDWWVGARTDRWTGIGRRDKDAWDWRPSDDDVDHALWADDEPSGDGQCGHIGSRFSGRLNDSDCDDEFDFICEGRIQP